MGRRLSKERIFACTTKITDLAKICIRNGCLYSLFNEFGNWLFRRCDQGLYNLLNHLSCNVLCCELTGQLYAVQCPLTSLFLLRSLNFGNLSSIADLCALFTRFDVVALARAFACTGVG